jgi:hypothetical protein
VAIHQGAGFGNASWMSSIPAGRSEVSRISGAAGFSSQPKAGHQSPGRLVGKAPVAHLARRDQIGEGRDGLAQRNRLLLRRRVNVVLAEDGDVAVGPLRQRPGLHAPTIVACRPIQPSRGWISILDSLSFIPQSLTAIKNGGASLCRGSSDLISVSSGGGL